MGALCEPRIVDPGGGQRVFIRVCRIFPGGHRAEMRAPVDKRQKGCVVRGSTHSTDWNSGRNFYECNFFSLRALYGTSICVVLYRALAVRPAITE